ncbi:uncharacterized protein DUF4928 [Fluviicoccus keumensis]|uniref:Uncharacterized protein DUF4928 n=1 Tax=Fluviicoccus keumensis TaxID=1435465 RepID=A0A4Q7ZDJ8_9GAMM|nr:DUF4928 family protein [Fluviicoccus keumensis]RZU47969.1 uncharacterized protein DUF4928 [Fluviicoccus keumensis]
MDDLQTRLQAFCHAKKIRGKGPLAVVLHLTRYAKEKGLPLDAAQLVTEGSGQVLGLGKGAVQKVLNDYGIKLVLAEEGGRTSRGSLGYMKDYVAFLNSLQADGLADMAAVEGWWIERVREHFSAKPFRLKFDPAKSMQAIIQDLLAQAKKRQQESSGTMYQGAMLQHLVGAKLTLAMPELTIEHHGASVADQVSGRSGDFVIDNTIIHITTSPGEAVVRKCLENINAGAKPIILTLADGVTVAKGLAAYLDLAGRIDIMDAEQFLAANLHELSLFKTAARWDTLQKLVEVYNQIVEKHETDPSLRIDAG